MVKVINFRKKRIGGGGIKFQINDDFALKKRLNSCKLAPKKMCMSIFVEKSSNFY